MKKLYMMAALFAANTSLAQTTVTFEDLTLGTESYYNGSDAAGEFTSGGVTFINYYDQDWDFWSGMAYSNMTDVTTSGAGNQYSSFAGGGSNSDNFGISYYGQIDFGTTAIVSSIDLTNTTYTALSMRDGDAYGKQFGSPNNADGDPDGTNGEDWFRVSIIGFDMDTVATDTVVFYLADYRFADNNDDYILNTWETVDISSLGTVRFIEFELESSDNGDFGMNTPAYFAFDNLVYGSLGTSTLSKVETTVYPNPATASINFKGINGDVSIYGTTGQLVLAGTTDGVQAFDISTLEAGTYFYAVNTAEGTATGKFIKH